MKKLIFTLTIFFAGTVNANISGALFITSGNTEAKLVINEGMVDGDLSKLFDQMKIAATGTNTKKTKTFQLSNGRFSFVCNKVVSTSSPPSTSCTFVIKTGSDTGDINTFISKTASQKVATIGMTKVFSLELAGIFPSDSSGLSNYLLKTENEASLEAIGSNLGNFTIGFAGR